MDPLFEAHVLDLVDWVIQKQRSCEEMIEACRQYRSRMRVWQEANRRGLIATDAAGGRCAVKPTPLGIMLGELRRESRRHARRARSSRKSGSALPSTHPWHEMERKLSTYRLNLHLLDDE